MTHCLIGHTGFVGGNLSRQHPFGATFNSANFREMEGGEFDLCVCCGISAVKWLANREPKKDLEAIRALQEVLDTVTAARFVLISTVDVYPLTEGVDEAYDCTGRPNHAYGRHQ